VLVGIVHGLAGSAAVALLVLATITDARWAAAYLLIFGVGTVFGMLVITAAIATPMIIAVHRFARLDRSLQLASGTLSVAFGLLIAAHIGIVEGLFASQPSWSPH
jgi:high-affinity nickel-transport protein